MNAESFSLLRVDTSRAPLWLALAAGKAVAADFDLPRLKTNVASHLKKAEIHWTSASSGSPIERALRDYFAGKSVPLESFAEPRWGTRFQREVWNCLKTIPHGEVLTYQQVAQRIGRPRAARAVGNALRQNPVCVLIPCHRVVARNGPGGFGGGLPLKRHLLALEGVLL